jgi:hypothetical protein
LAAMCGTVGAACSGADLVWAGPWWGCHGPAVFFWGGRGAGEGRPARAARRWGPPGDKVAGLRNSAR